MRSPRALSTALVLSLIAAACADASSDAAKALQGSDADRPVSAARPAAIADAPADRFLATLASHCGKAYAGRIVANLPTTAGPDAFDGRRLVMHVRGCDAPTEGLRVPFHVGEDRSRTWVLTRTATGLRLKHDHRHADGTDDAVTLYGGDTTDPGTPGRQTFPVDADSIALFEREELPASVTNTWAMEIDANRFVYELGRPDGRLFRVEFDLTAPVPPPPAPWGDTGA